MPGSHLAEASFRVTDSGVPGNQWVDHPMRLERLLLQCRNLRPGMCGRDVLIVAQCSLSAGSAASAVTSSGAPPQRARAVVKGSGRAGALGGVGAVVESCPLLVQKDHALVWDPPLVAGDGDSDSGGVPARGGN